MKTVKLLILFSFAKLFAVEIDEPFYDFDIQSYQLGRLKDVLSDINYEAFQSDIEAKNSGWIVSLNQDAEFVKGELVIYRCYRYGSVFDSYWLYGIATGESEVDETGKKYWYVYNGMHNMKISISRIGILGDSIFVNNPHYPRWDSISTNCTVPFGILCEKEIIGYDFDDNNCHGKCPQGWHCSNTRKLKRGELVLCYSGDNPGWAQGYKRSFAYGIIMGQAKIDENGMPHWYVFGVGSKPQNHIYVLDSFETEPIKIKNNFIKKNKKRKRENNLYCDWKNIIPKSNLK